MSAEVLRRAAALMRERAEAARAGLWLVHPSELVADASLVVADWEHAPRRVAICSGSLAEGNQANAEHIASWHPGMALMVADWLDTAGADLWAHGPLHCADGCAECDDELWAPHVRRALIVARTYLKEQS